LEYSYTIKITDKRKEKQQRELRKIKLQTAQAQSHRSHLCILAYSSISPNAMSIMEMILGLPNERKPLTCILLWDWWTNRNKLNAGELGKSAGQMCHTIQKHAIEFQTVTRPPANFSDGVYGEASPLCDVWKRPGPGQVKINFDAAFWEPTRSGAWGFVVRDENGEFVAAAAGKLRHLRSALQAEAEACVAAVEGAEALGLHRIIFESDCQVLVSALNSNSHDLAEIGVLLREVRSRCVASFQSSSFVFCRRVCNKVAHSCAHLGSKMEDECVGWADEAPAFVSVLVASESAEHSG
jgi:ribonuclease HI